MPVVGFLSGWKPVATDMTRPPSPLAMLIATYKAAPIQGGTYFPARGGGRTASGRIVLGTRAVSPARSVERPPRYAELRGDRMKSWPPRMPERHGFAVPSRPALGGGQRL
jgi:hypothetical protein